jgi:hypothetical protein
MASVIPYLQLIGISAIIGGGVSALINYVMTMRVLKKKNRAELIENKLDLYSFIIFYLDRMRFTGEALKKVNKDSSKQEIFGYRANENIDELFKPIEEKLQNKYYLLKQDIFQQYISVKTLFAEDSTKEDAPKLRKMLIDEYNSSIVIEYEKLTGKKLEKLK